MVPKSEEWWQGIWNVIFLPVIENYFFSQSKLHQIFSGTGGVNISYVSSMVIGGVEVEDFMLIVTILSPCVWCWWHSWARVSPPPGAYLALGGWWAARSPAIPPQPPPPPRAPTVCLPSPLHPHSQPSHPRICIALHTFAFHTTLKYADSGQFVGFEQQCRGGWTDVFHQICAKICQ